MQHGEKLGESAVFAVLAECKGSERESQRSRTFRPGRSHIHICPTEDSVQHSHRCPRRTALAPILELLIQRRAADMRNAEPHSSGPSNRYQVADAVFIFQTIRTKIRVRIHIACGGIKTNWKRGSKVRKTCC